MRLPKQKKRTDTNSNLLESTGKHQQATATSQSNPMVQQISQMGNAPNPSTHAAVLNRAPANQQSSNQQLLLQLQRQHGNSYVNQVLQLKRSSKKSAKPSTPKQNKPQSNAQKPVKQKPQVVKPSSSEKKKTETNNAKTGTVTNTPVKKVEAAKEQQNKTQKGIGKDKTGKKRETSKQQEEQKHEQKVKAGLAAIDKEETKYLKKGRIIKEDAEKVAAKVKKQYPVFKKLTVIDSGARWDYEYAASPFGIKFGRKKREEVTVDTVDVEGQNWKKYMEVSLLTMNVEKFTLGQQFGHNILIKIVFHNYSKQRLNLISPPPLEYFEEITKIDGNRQETRESQDQYAKHPNSNTIRTYNWGTVNRTVEPGGSFDVMFLDPPQLTITDEYKSRTVRFRIGLRGTPLSEKRTGVQTLTCDNGQIIEHEFET